MNTIVKRLIKGQDLKKETEYIIKEEKIEAGIILSGVGCVSVGRFRLADEKELLIKAKKDRGTV